MGKDKYITISKSRRQCIDTPMTVGEKSPHSDRSLLLIVFGLRINAF